MIDNHLYLYAGTVALFVVIALAIAATGLVVFAGLAIVYSVIQTRRRKLAAAVSGRVRKQTRGC